MKLKNKRVSFWLKPIISFFHYHRLKPVVMNSTSTGFSQMDKNYRIKKL
ncbi:MAG: hypothetical protein JSS98_04440 [Bacteroidetes bacterium]|nr:hypothetical protein [Bacteroidota bacterium]